MIESYVRRDFQRVFSKFMKAHPIHSSAGDVLVNAIARTLELHSECTVISQDGFIAVLTGYLEGEVEREG